MPDNWIQTVTGRHYNLTSPTPEQVDIRDIAWSLSNIARYNGHTKRFYSVGEHCLHAATLAPAGMELEALLHDASEAYLGDVASPLKELLPAYKSLEARHQAAVRTRFGLAPEQPTIVGTVDFWLLCVEARYMLDLNASDWPLLEGQPAALQTIIKWKTGTTANKVVSDIETKEPSRESVFDDFLAMFRRHQ
jgi:hypothetical protein